MRRDFGAAQKLLRECLTISEAAAARDDAASLLRQIDAATSDNKNLALLAAMTEPELERALATATIADGLVSDPTLLAARAESIRRVLPIVEQEQEKVRLVEAERQRQIEAELLAAEELRLQQEAEAAAFAEMQRRRDNPTVRPQLEDVANFPERYAGEVVCFERVRVMGDVERISWFNDIFCIPMYSARDKYFTGRGSGLYLATSDAIAEKILHQADANEYFIDCDVYAEIQQMEINGKVETVAYVYRIVVYNLGGNVGFVLE